MATASSNGHDSPASYDTVLALIERNPNISRSDIARLTGMSRNTTSQIARDLLHLGVIQEIGKISATGGRPGIGLEIRPNAVVALGAALDTRRWVLALVNLLGEVIDIRAESVDPRNPTASLRSLAEGIRALRQDSPYPVLPAVGIGVPGMVEPESGVVTQANDLGWNEVPIKETIERVTKIQSFVINRHWAAALAEGRWGGAADTEEFIYIGIGTGIRSAAYSKGRLIEGATSLAGQLGHMTVAADGPLCTCGNRGCLVSFASEQALVDRVTMAIQHGAGTSLTNAHPLSAGEICAAAKAGDKVACDALQQASLTLGIAIANLINLFNPERIVLGGPVGNTGEPLLSTVTAAAKQRSLSANFAQTRLVSSILGDRAEAIGAATLVLDRKLELLTHNRNAV